MSVLPIGPLVGSPQQPTAPGSGSQGATPPTGTENPGGMTAVQPPQDSGTENNTGSSTSYSGTGAGAGGSAAQQPLRAAKRFSRPPDAAPNSVVNAQFSGQRASEPGKGSDDLRRSTIRLPDPQEMMSIMPNPLPTSPFLKGAENAA